jgi:hypothetical protein
MLIKSRNSNPNSSYKLLFGDVALGEWASQTNSANIGLGYALEKYYEEYKPKELREQQTYKERKKYIQFGVILGIIGLIVYSYGK